MFKNFLGYLFVPFTIFQASQDSHTFSRLLEHNYLQILQLLIMLGKSGYDDNFCQSQETNRRF